jgi:hypothetical protein
MKALKESVNAWEEAGFKEVLREELQRLGVSDLPLQQGITSGSYVVDKPFRAMVIDWADAGTHIRVKAGIFYAGIIAGCNCSDDPTPVDETTEYCEVEILIDKTSGEFSASLAPG